MKRLLSKVLGRLFPRPEDGNPCHEAAFDPDQMPGALREKVERAKSGKPEKSERNDSGSRGGQT